RRTLLERRNQRLHVLELFPRELGHGLNSPALGKARAPQPRAALTVAQHHIAAAFLALDRRGNWLGLRWQRIAGLVEIDNRFALGVAGAAEELPESSAPLDHFLAALVAFVLADFAHHRLALRIDRQRAIAGRIAR